MVVFLRRSRKWRLRLLLTTCFVLTAIKVYWESSDVRESFDFIRANLTISSEEARKFSNHRYLINHEQKCVDQDVFLLLFIKSSPENVERRQAIRSTWGSEDYIKRNLGMNVRVLFALGLPPQPRNRKKLHQMLLREDQAYQDLIQQDFLDTFHNLTVKLLLQLGWTHAYCAHARFLMSADDDIFVHVPNLIGYLQEVDRAHVKDFWVGKVNRGSLPSRRKNNKYYVPHEMYPWDRYPDYTSGAAYVVSRDVASRVYQASLTLNASLYIDDVFMGICAHAVEVSPREHVFFSGEATAPHHVCVYNQIITSHGHVQDVQEIWKLVMEAQQLETGLFGKLYCAVAKIRYFCASQTIRYPCKTAFL